ncbi:EamA/RhaT family transporter, partial [Pseudomonas sp. MWU13-2625]
PHLPSLLQSGAALLLLPGGLWAVRRHLPRAHG